MKKSKSKSTKAKSNSRGVTVKPMAVSINTTVNNGMGARRPFNVKHREMLGSIRSGADSTLSLSFPISPSKTESFPWLSQLAANFEYYQFKRLCIRYIPRCSTMFSGSVVMAFDYDCLDAAPLHMEDLQLYMGSRSFNVYTEDKAEADQRSLHFYPYRYLNSSGEDARLESIGNFYLMLNASAANTIYGDLFVEYDVDLFAPQFAENETAMFSISQPADSTVTNNPFYGTLNMVGNALGLVLQNSSTEMLNIIFKNAGKYLLTYRTCVANAQPYPMLIGDPLGILRSVETGQTMKCSGNSAVAEQANSNYFLIDVGRELITSGLGKAIDLHIADAVSLVAAFATTAIWSYLHVAKVSDSYTIPTPGRVKYVFDPRVRSWSPAVSTQEGGSARADRLVNKLQEVNTTTTTTTCGPCSCKTIPHL